MAQAKWYSLTPARQQLLVALVIAVLAFGAILARQLDLVGAIRDLGQPQNGPVK